MTPTPGPPYEWDEDKRQETLRLRGLDFPMAYQIDWPTATYEQQERSGETRYASLAMINGRLHHVVLAPGSPNTRIISMRKANNRESARYDQQQT